MAIAEREVWIKKMFSEKNIAICTPEKPYQFELASDVSMKVLLSKFKHEIFNRISVNVWDSLYNFII